MPALLNSQMLLETFVNFGVEYAGLIPEIPIDMDPTGRTDILKVIDSGKKNGFISTSPGGPRRATLGLNAYSIRIVASGDDEVLLTAPVHQIAAVCHVTEGADNILGIRIGEVGSNREINDLAVLHCESKASAEEICTLIGQCFQLVFSEATMQCFDKRVVEGAPASSINKFMDHTGSVSTVQTYGPEGPSFISGSRTDLTRIQPCKPPQRSTSTTHSESDRASANANELIHEYMNVLHATLKAEELKQFAIYLKRWRDHNLPFCEFFQKVLELFGPERKYLLARMRPFIRQEDLGSFKGFLEQAGATDNAECSLTSCSPQSELSVSSHRQQNPGPSQQNSPPRRSPDPKPGPSGGGTTQIMVGEVELDDLRPSASTRFVLPQRNPALNNSKV